MKRIFLLAVALFIATSSFAQNEYNYQKRSLFELLPIEKRDIVFLGNSITDGAEWSEIFANPRIKNRGISADWAKWLIDRIDPIIKGQPRKVFLMIGTNDLASGVTPEAVVGYIANVVDRFQKESPRTELYIQSVLPVNGVDPKSSARKHWTRGAEILETNKLLVDMCAQKGITYIDIFSSLVDDKGMLDIRYSNDGLHLMGNAYMVWKGVVEKYIK